MSKCCLSNGDDHPEAAEKHLEDAQVLEKCGRYDGAAYHAGYVIECCLKTMVLIETENDPIWMTQGGPGRHNLRDLSKSTLIFASLSSSKTARYNRAMTSSHDIYNSNSGWSESLRYRAKGFIDASRASSWVKEAKSVFSSTILQMRMDGVI